MRSINVTVLLLLSLSILGGGCAAEKKVPTAANKEEFTGPAMPEEARARMREEQAKAMAKAGAGTAPAAPGSGSE